MLAVSREGCDLFQQVVSAKEKYDCEQKMANVNSVKLGGGKDFPYDAILEGAILKDHERLNAYIRKINLQKNSRNNGNLTNGTDEQDERAINSKKRSHCHLFLRRM